MAADRLLTSPDRQKVVLHADWTQSLGISIRGGKEYSLGIYISMYVMVLGLKTNIYIISLQRCTAPNFYIH